MELVVIESPFGGYNLTDEEVERNLRYVRDAMHDCFLRGEAPFASHALYTQEGVLDDKKHEERILGMEAGFCWGKHASKVVVYVDLGISSGMKQGIERAKLQGKKVEERSLSKWNQR